MDISCGAEVSEAARLRSLHEPATSLPLNFSLPVPDDWDNFNSVWCWEELPSLFELDDPIESLQNHQFPSPASSVESNNPPAFYFDGCCIDPRLLVLGNPNGGPDPGEFSNFPQTPVLTPASTPALSYGTPTPVSSPASIYGASTPQASGREALLVDPIGSSPSLCRSTRGPVPKDLKCSYLSCEFSASTAKDVNRHVLQVHGKPGPGELREGWYVCQCSYLTPRKEDLKRHRPTCKKKPVRDDFVCRCLGQFIDIDAFYEHILTCGAKSRGRPKQSSLPLAGDVQENG